MSKDKAHLQISLLLCPAGMVLFAPFALLAAPLSPNDYVALGIEGAADCDGLLKDAIFAVPRFLAYRVSALVLSARAVRRKSWNCATLAIRCILPVASVIPNGIGAYREHSSQVHEEAWEG